MPKKGFVICVICILMLVCFPCSNGKFVNDPKKDVLTGDPGTIKPGFIFGPYESSTWDGDLLVLIAGFQPSPARSLNFIVPFRSDHLHVDEQIKLAQSNNCIFMKNFVIGFCKIYSPQSDISMHVLSQNDPENEVTWIVDGIIGDKVWESNIDVELYTESGERSGGFSYGPLGKEYLSVGDQITVSPDVDGYYSVKFTESISRDVLFESPLVKY